MSFTLTAGHRRQLEVGLRHCLAHGVGGLALRQACLGAPRFLASMHVPCASPVRTQVLRTPSHRGPCPEQGDCVLVVCLLRAVGMQGPSVSSRGRG